MIPHDNRPGGAVIVLSGGQDSTTCLVWAQRNIEGPLHALSFDYGQRHKRELVAAEQIAKLAGIPHRILPLDTLPALGGNALTNHAAEIKQDEGQLPNTFVPGRNILFLTAAAAYAYNLGVSNLVTGVCETDYSGYPDCRGETMDALELTLRLALEMPGLKIHTPLMRATKAETVRYMAAAGAEAWLLLGLTHTCYNGQYPPCGTCPACELRAKGFAEAGLEDPLLEVDNAD